MEFEMLFITCKPYDFVDGNTNKRVQGVTVYVYDQVNDSIVKCKSDKVISMAFGEPITIEARPNGRYINYFVA
jgi:hypothetical protein